MSSQTDYCSSCGKEIFAQARFCTYCGTQRASSTSTAQDGTTLNFEVRKIGAWSLAKFLFMMNSSTFYNNCTNSTQIKAMIAKP